MTTTATLPVRTKAEKAWVSEGLSLEMDPATKLFQVMSHNSPKTYHPSAGMFDDGLQVRCDCVKGAIDHNAKVAVARCKHAAGLCRTLEVSGMLVFDSGQMTWVASPAVAAAMVAA